MKVKFIGRYKVGVGRDMRFPEPGNWRPDEVKTMPAKQAKELITANLDFVQWHNVEPEPELIEE